MQEIRNLESAPCVRRGPESLHVFSFSNQHTCLIGREEKKEPVRCVWYSTRGFYEPDVCPARSCMKHPG